MSTQYDLIVIGSGPGGYVSAIRASQLGMKTAIVERESLGGICLNWGCIPTKALLRSAEVLHLAKNAKEFGLKIDKADFDLDAVVKRSRGVANQLSTGVKFLMKKNKIDVIEGTARLEKGTQAPKVIVKGKDGKETSFQAKHVMLATGARARDIPQAGLVADKKLIWTYREAMTPDVMPKRLLVIGSGAIGIEFASFYHELGAEVTVAEVMDRILPVVVDSGHSRFPVIGESKDQVIGLLLAKDLLRFSMPGNGENFELTKFLRPAVFVPESKRVNVLLKDFRGSRNHMALVVDEYGGVSGLVTIEDVLELIVGEIDDEYDEIEGAAILKQEDNRYLVNGLTPIEDFNAHFGCEFSDEEFDTVGGLVIHRFGHMPRRGETVSLERFKFTVQRADSRRVHLLQVLLNDSA